jgi:cysteinyl-tRNA synthetase
LQTHYRNPVDFTDEALETATHSWHTLKEGLLFGPRYGQQLGWQLSSSVAKVLVERFQEAVDNDFNFASGLAVLFEIAKKLVKEGNLLVHEGKTETPAQQLGEQWQTLVELAQILGLETELEHEAISGLSDAAIEALIEQRAQVRQAKNWAESDRIRDELKAQGIALIDQAGGATRWHRL